MTRRVVLVCGGRDFNDWLLMTLTLDEVDSEDHPISLLINGAARGADKMSTNWALCNGTDYVEYPADWDKYGRAAGAIRNRQMLVEGKPDLVVAFPGGAGTANMIKQARDAGVEVMIVAE